ncbi:MAG TPA: hypothetical protein VJX66_26780 [Amycolatopsis sp.]|nr:hypothetical protein [Amycolatopsis sp.]
MTETTKQEGFRAPLALALMFCAWLFGVPYLLFRAAFALPWEGEVTDAERAEQAALLTWAGWAAVLLPVLGLILALLTRQKGPSIAFGVVLGVSLLAIGLSAFDHRNDHPRPAPRPEPTHCVPRSGSFNDCPGG